MSFDRLTAMRTFAAVAHSGSFAGAAKRMRTSTSAVSRKVAELERSMGVRLLQRTTRRLQLTDSGRIYLDGCERILQLLDDVEAQVAEEDHAPRGRLRVAAQITPHSFVRTVNQFSQQYPDVDIEIMRVNRPVDMIEEQFDIWLHVFGPIPANHIARPLHPMPLMVAAAPEYLERRGTPTHPRQLAKHACLITNVSRDSNPWQFERNGERVSLTMPNHFVCNDTDVLIGMAVAGAGIVRQPVDLLAADIRQGRLHQLFKGWKTLASLHVSAVYPSARHVPLKVRKFLDLLTRNLNVSGALRAPLDADKT